MTHPIQRLLKQRRPFATLEEEVFVGLQLASERLMEPWSRRLRERAELTAVQYNVLRILRGAASEGLRTQELSERLISRSPDVTRLIDRLERRGLVARCREAEDARAVRLHITAEGRERIEPLDDQVRELLRDLLRPVGQERLDTLREILGEVLDAIHEDREAR